MREINYQNNTLSVVSIEEMLKGQKNKKKNLYLGLLQHPEGGDSFL